MDNNISFKGLNNVLCLSYKNKMSGNSMTSGIKIISELTNEGTRDLDEWEHVLERFPNSDNFVNTTLEANNIESVGNRVFTTPDSKISIFLNGKIVDTNDENLPAFSQMTKHFRQIEQQIQAKKPFTYNGNYIVGLEQLCKEMQIKPIELPEETIQTLQNSEILKLFANTMNEAIKSNMNKYFHVASKN